MHAFHPSPARLATITPAGGAWALVIVFCSTLSLAGCRAPSTIEQSKTSQTDPGTYFAEHVRPVLEKNCVKCHHGSAAPAGLDLSRRSGAFRWLKSGRKAIIPGHPDTSMLITAVSRSGDHPLLMPNQQRLSLTEDEIGMLREWIEDGAHWPRGWAGRLEAESNPESASP